MFTETPFTLFLLLINVLVSGYGLFYDQHLIDRLSFKPHRVLRDREYYRLITAGFVHGSMGHLAFNMITLYFFGPALEMRLGSVAFLVIYFGAELTAHCLTLWLQRQSRSYAAVGASGAISGVIFSFCLFQPFALLGLMMVIPVPAWLFAVGFIGFSIYAMKRRDDKRMGGIAHEAHLGGALGGVLFTLLVEPSALSIFLRQVGL